MKFLLKTFLLIFCIDISIQQLIEMNFIQKKANTYNKNKNYLSFLEEDLNVLINQRNQIILEIKVGSNKQISNVLVDTGSNILWIAGKNCQNCKGIKNKFDASSSSSYRNTSIPMKIAYVSGSTEGYLGYEDFYLEKTSLENLKFLLSYDSGTDMDSDGILGLGNNYYFDSDSLSLIDQLYFQKKISKRIFTIKLDSKINKGVLSIGDLPEEIKNNNRNITNKNYGKCKALPNSKNGNPNISWECRLDQFFFGDDLNKTITIADRVNFDSGTNIIFVPLNFMKRFIINEYLAYYLYNRMCIAVPNESYISIVCDSRVNYMSLPNMNFRFGEYVIFLRPEELFLNSGAYLHFIMTASVDESFNDFWIIGEPIFKKMSIVFDKENQEIGFFGNDVKNVGEIGKDKFSPRIVIIILIVSIIAALVFAVIYFAVKYFQKRNEQNFTNYNRFNGRLDNNPINSDF